MSEIDDKIAGLERRIKQIESALLAVATGQPVGCTEDGLIIALPQPKYTSAEIYDRQRNPGAKPQ